MASIHRYWPATIIGDLCAGQWHSLYLLKSDSLVSGFVIKGECCTDAKLQGCGIDSRTSDDLGHCSAMQ